MRLAQDEIKGLRELKERLDRGDITKKEFDVKMKQYSQQEKDMRKVLQKARKGK